MKAALGFVPDWDIYNKIRETGVEDLARDYDKLQSEKDPVERRKIQDRMANTTKALAGLIGEGGAFAGLHNAKGPAEMLRLFQDQNLTMGDFKLLGEPGDKDAQIAVLRRVSGAMAGMTDQMVAETAAQMDPRDRRLFESRARFLQVEATISQGYLDQLDAETDPVEKAKIIAKLTGESSGVLAGGLGLLLGAHSARENALSKGSYTSVTRRMELAGEAIDAMRSFVGANVDENYEGALAAYSRARSKNLAIGRVFFTTDSKGKAILNESLVQEMVQMDPSLRTSKAREAKATVIRAQLRAFHHDAQEMTDPTMMDAKGLKALQKYVSEGVELDFPEDIKQMLEDAGYGVPGIDERRAELFDPSGLVAGNKYSPDDILKILHGPSAGKWVEEKRILTGVEQLMSVLSKDLSGKDAAGKAKQVLRSADLIRTMLGKHMAGGGLSPKLMEVVASRYGMDRANSMLSILSQVAEAGGTTDDMRKVLTEEIEKEEAKRKAAEAEAEEKSKKNINIKFIFDGEEVTKEITLEVSSGEDNSKKGREASEKVDLPERDGR